jgi:hypothetical protein
MLPNDKTLDFLGPWAARAAALHPLQRQALLRADITDPHGAVRLREDLPLEVLRHVPHLANSRLFLGALAKGEIRATAQGNLNRKFVLAIAAEMQLPERYQEAPPHFRFNKEDDIWPVRVLRAVLQAAGLMRKYRGAFRITRRGAAFVDDAAAGQLFALLFRTFYGVFNLAFLDSMEEDSWLQTTFPHSLWMIGRLTGQWLDVGRLRELILVESDPKTLEGERRRAETDEVLRWMPRPLWRFEIRIIEPLVEFGLLERRIDPASNEEGVSRRFASWQVRKTSLFDRFISFEI